ncbi:unnamed protein product [Acanthoscelides obtectus]|uniref:Uncharacterized protein n=1 Tax=Acanthoscelides obtectus TaxID=200917 RepID=A0A9P0JTB8_ACAOB|nr:unnamed protein product [Acanthoscelides obtectus]CAK1641129.1 hypothetical protein AOBTE_LOCUS12178 [Acanthoscelides obtectus]
MFYIFVINSSPVNLCVFHVLAAIIILCENRIYPRYVYDSTHWRGARHFPDPLRILYFFTCKTVFRKIFITFLNTTCK